MSINKRIKLGLTEQFQCSYIPEQQEQLLVVLDRQVMNHEDYQSLMMLGFRRSGADIYRPHCPNCNSCKSLRILCETFSPSKSQKRIANKNRDLSYYVSREITEEHFELYRRYITARHRDGSMYPPSWQQLHNFANCDWLDTLFLEVRLGKQLVAVAVTDTMLDSLSALYTFYAPEMEARSLGSACVLKQIELCQLTARDYLYLGYQVDECPAMAYKSRFQPCEELVNGRWQAAGKKPLV